LIYNSFKDEILLDFEVFIIDHNLNLEKIKKERKFKLNGKIIGTINKVPFYQCDIISKQNILIGKINKILDFSESVEIEQKFKE
jgi:hypothetical protein